ncbi:hypothetical protein WA026_014943 [Henosepilachna vigintioctopunctata]|uniref:Uncharacterized protein n=1 Tax=Henosepilachna vigintioctopunctata TaxID=420089 RepID=A0AAW1UYD2_9CUCU
MVFVEFINALSPETIFSLFRMGVFKEGKVCLSDVVGVINNKILFENAVINSEQYQKLCEAAREQLNSNEEALNTPLQSSTTDIQTVSKND